MNGVEVIIASLNSKIEKLILLHKTALEENRQLTRENTALREDLEKLTKQVSETEHQYKNTQLTEIPAELGFEKDELKGRLDAMIGEIDKCLAILNQ